MEVVLKHLGGLSQFIVQLDMAGDTAVLLLLSGGLRCKHRGPQQRHSGWCGDSPHRVFHVQYPNAVNTTM
ncbi:hypothetical protein D3C83_66950 [compost metagenome]